ncbi:MAG: hypothetical protein JW384_02428 [Nitrosomonadaceae bacterium]|nr:hypothetical protein [Nitrosomonadaceae bacterium]
MSRSDEQRIEDILEYAGKIASAVERAHDDQLDRPRVKSYA